ncbi:FAD binding domain-containing protein [Thozetella sp. PMI_491]|nr:FAD binding domain-containing protein [Thozetella sp. PMI_491]
MGACSVVCDTLLATTNIPQYLPGSPEFVTEQSHYWSTAASALLPACILAPTTAQEVATIVQVLLSTNESFAIKSGGHNPNNFFASINGGALISTLNMKDVILDVAAETVRIGPGNRWDGVAATLDGTGYTVIGGRIGNVGVGGYLLGGGLSFMSTEYGWAANNVLEYELVLSNATVVTVSSTSHPDLFLALKGGGNNYGIVTSFLVKAHPQGEVWGGNIVFNATNETNTAILAAVRGFTQAYPDDKAGIILTAELSGGGIVDIWVLFLYYNGPVPPAGVFDAFTSIGAWSNTCKTQSYSALLSGNNWAVIKGSVYTIGTETVPLPDAGVPSAGLEVLQSIHDHWREVSTGVQDVAGVIASIAFQPFPRSLARLARDSGGDLYDFDDSVDRIIVELDFSFWLQPDFDRIDQAMQDTYGGIRERVQSFTAQGVLPDAFLPLFANDAYFREDLFGRLRPDRQALAAQVRDDVDAAGLWKSRTGGFKIDNA